MTTQLGDLTRLTTKIGDSTSTSGLDGWKEVTRYGSQISRGLPMPRTEREGSQTGTNTTRITVQLGNMTRPTTQPGSMTKLKETSVTGEEQAIAAEESNYGSGEAEISSGPHALYIEQEGGQTVMKMTRLTTQLGGMTRSTTQAGDMTRLMEWIGGQAGTSSRDAWNKVTKKPGGGNESRAKNTRDLELRSGMAIKIMVEDGIVLEGTVLKRTKKKSGKFPSNSDINDNASGEIIEYANYDRVVWNAENEEEK